MLCSHCHQTLRLASVNSQRGKGFQAQVQCPHCKAWLGRSPRLAKCKLFGFYALLLAVVASYFYANTRPILFPVMIVFLVVLFVGHLMDQLITIEAPPQIDDSDQRKKYR